jgi:G3E family GTPase
LFQDIVILNKVDLVSAEGSGALKELEAEIHSINSLVEIIHSVRCQVDLSKILNRHAYDTAVSYTYFCSSSIVFSSDLHDHNLPLLPFFSACHTFRGIVRRKSLLVY